MGFTPYVPKGSAFDPVMRVEYHKRSWPEVNQELMERFYPGDPDGVELFGERVDRALARWACITAKSQRRLSGNERDQYEISVFDRLTEIKPVFKNMESKAPPSREGERIQEYSQRSHNRLMKKFKKLRKDHLPLPFFITLTYQENMMDFERVKRNLNAFLQRLRRWDSEKKKRFNTGTGRWNTFYENWPDWDGFKYVWKMEPQGRGAVHFHLCIFVDPRSFPKAWRSDTAFKIKGVETSRQCEYLKILVSSVWNVISGQSEDFEPVRSKSKKYFGNMALLAGTNVRPCHNWDMATGYLSKYMEKEVDGDKWRGQAPGRFWGFSNNFDFSAYYREIYDQERIQETRQKLWELSVKSWEEYQDRELASIKRLENNHNACTKEVKKRIYSIRKRMLKQRKRFLINQMKIEEAGMIQLEISWQASKLTLTQINKNESYNRTDYAKDRPDPWKGYRNDEPDLE